MNLVEENIHLEFEISETGHQVIEAKINGKRLHFILDTAAGASVINRACLAELGVKEVISECAAGLGTSEHEMGEILVPEIELGGKIFEFEEFISLNLDHVQVVGGGKGIHGLLGSPFFTKHEAVIDFRTNRVTLCKPRADNSKP